MTSRIQRKFLTTFLLIFLLPIMAFVIVSGRMIVQERELASKRRADDRDRRIRQIRDALYAALEDIRSTEVSRRLSGDEAVPAPFEPSSMLVGRVEDGRLNLPWERSGSSRPAVSRLSGLLQDAERLELEVRDQKGACDLYTKAIEVADASEAVQARLGLVRTCDDRDYRHLRALLSADPTLVDDLGVPWRLYAAARAARIAGLQAELEHSLNGVLRSGVELTPAAAYMMRDIVGSLRQPDMEAEVQSRVERIEHGLELQNRFAALFPSETRTTAGRQTWTATSQGWLTSVTPLGSKSGLLVAVRSDSLFEELKETSAGANIHLARLSAAGERLGPEFPGVGIVIEEPGAAQSGSGGLREPVLIGGIVIIVLLTGFSGWLVYRDVRREVGLAELRSQFVSSITHELRTPLTSIRMFAEMLQLHRGRSVEKAQQYLETIVHESERLTRLVDDVLLFARIERGEKTYRFSPMCLQDVVREVAQEMEYQFALKGFSLEVEIDGPDMSVLADRDALIQAILNLLTNAMKYSGDSKQIGLRLRRENSTAVIEVVDSGLGMTAEEQTRIFESFYRAPNPEVKNIPGAGIGLSLVSQIVHAHRGEVRVESQPGIGSKFSILIPMEQTA